MLKYPIPYGMGHSFLPVLKIYTYNFNHPGPCGLGLSWKDLGAIVGSFNHPSHASWVWIYCPVCGKLLVSIIPAHAGWVDGGDANNKLQ